MEGAAIVVVVVVVVVLDMEQPLLRRKQRPAVSEHYCDDVREHTEHLHPHRAHHISGNLLFPPLLDVFKDEEGDDDGDDEKEQEDDNSNDVTKDDDNIAEDNGVDGE
jgi:hypothetical protein